MGTPLDDDEQKLVRRAQDGDAAAFAEIYRRWYAAVQRQMSRFVGPTDADDLAQEFFLRLMDKIGLYKPISPFGAWLSTVGGNFAKDYCRRKKIDPLVGAVEAKGETIEHRRPVESFDVEKFHDCLEKTPSPFRETLRAQLYECDSGDEIAAKMHVSRGTVDSRISRGKAMIRECMERGRR